MDEMKHTPGPWSLSEKYHSVNVRAVDGPYVADCNASAAIGWETKQANARLIAAAPDMYEALIMQRAYIEHWLEDVSANLKPTVATLDDALAAIYGALAKAEGRS